MPSVIVLNVTYAECCNAECRYAECPYSECHYTECRSAAGKTRQGQTLRLILKFHNNGPCGLYYKSFTIVIYSRIDSGQYNKSMIMIIIYDHSLI